MKPFLLNFPLKNRLIPLIAFLGILFSKNLVFAEGTKQISSDSTVMTALAYMPSINSGPFLGASEDNRIYFRINDHTSENLYYGFNWTAYSGTTQLTNMYYRIFSPSGVPLDTIQYFSSGAGFIPTHARAFAGPNIGGANPSGYNPLVFNPSENGEFYIEVYRSNDFGISQITPFSSGDWAKAAYWDLTVSTASNNQSTGRIHSDKWGLVAIDPTTWVPNGQASGAPTFFAYTNDQSIVKFDFSTGFRPIAFNVAMNSYGIVNTGNFLTDRRSRNDATAPSLANGYKIFLEAPDPASYPYGAVPSLPSFNNPAVTGCGPYNLNFWIAEPGDVKIIFNFDGVPGYQIGQDLVLEGFNLPAGNNSLIWNGNNGLGIPVPNGTNLDFKLTYQKGRFNLPLYDAEINLNGITFEVIAPVATTNIRLFWDDSNLTNVGTICDNTGGTQANNIMGAGINNSIFGSLSPAHAWSGTGNYLQIIPAPDSLSNSIDNWQCNDFGNVRTINTWGYGYVSDTVSFSINKGCANLFVSKEVNNSTPVVGNNVIFTIEAQNLGTIDASEVVVTDLLPSGYTYISHSAPSGTTYDQVTGLWEIGDLGNLANQVLTITASVNPIGQYLNNATIDAKEFDNDLSNNIASETITPLFYPGALNDESLNNVPGDPVTLNILINDTLQNGNQPLPSEVTVDLNPALAGNQDTLTVAGEGQWVYNPATGELTFTPESGFTTDPSDITYTLTENSTGLSDNATVNVEYTEVPPIATDDEDLANVPGTAVTLNILANDQLSDGSPATVSNTTVDLNPALAGNQDTLTVAGEGQWVYNPATGELTFTPESGFTTDPSDITYTLTENSTGLSDNATVNVEYTEVPPVATDDEDLANVPGTSVTLNILANDQLSDGSPATVSNTTVDLNPALAGNQDTLTVAGEGQWVYNPATGELTFTPESGFTTDPSDITYTLTENTTGLSDNATVNVEYTEVPPVATDDEDLANVPGTAVTLNILANDQLSDGSPATVSNTTVDLNPALAGNQDTLTVAGEGQWVYNPATGELTFTPESGFTTDPSDITYTLTENTTGLSDNAIVNVEYTEVPPVATDDEDLANVPGTAVTLNILANDQLSDGSPATVSNTTVDLNPALAGNQDTLTVAGEGQWVYNPSTGELTFTPESGFTTDPSDITYTLTENSTGLSDNAIVNVEYTEVPPVATDDEDLANVPGTAVTLNILANDQLSDGSPATVSNTTVDLNPALAGNQDTLTVAGEGQWVYNPSTGELTFTPESGFTTDPSDITYTLTENSTGLSDNATVNVEYTEVPPIATDDEDLANVPGTAVTLNILANDQLSDGSPATVSNTTVDLNPALAGNQDTLTVAGEGQWVYNPATGELTFTPESGFTTDPSDITYTLTENSTGLSDNATVNVEYTEVPPVATDDEDLANVPGTSVTLNILANDQLSDGSPATVSNTTVDLNPALAGNQDTLTVAGEGQWVYNPSTGELTFTPESGFTTDPSDITYTLTENTTGLSDNAIVNVEYTEVPPVATDDEDLANVPGTAVTLNILANDQLSDGSPATVSNTTVDLNPALAGNQDTLTVAGEGQWVYNPSTGELTFTPESGFTTDPSDITYTLTENTTGLSDNAIVNVEYTEVPPVATDDEDLANVPGTAVTLNILANDQLSDGSPATVSNTTVDLNPALAGNQDTLTVAGEGQWVYNPSTGELTFTPESGFTTDPSDITYTLTENTTGLSDNATINVEYTEVPPVATDDEDLANVPGTAVTLNILANDQLSDGSPATVSNTTVDLNPALAGNQDTLTVAGEGQWVYNPSTGELTFTPESGFTTDPSDITYTLTENTTGLSDNATINVEYTEVPPVATDDEDLANVPGTAVTLNILANDQLSDGSPATVSNTTVDLNPALAGNQDTLTVAGEGQWVYNPATGELTFTPESGFTTDPSDITYTLTENTTGLSDNATVNVEYTEVPPVATDDEDLANVPGTAVTLNILANDQLSDGSPATVSNTTVDLNPALAGNQDTLTVAGEGQWVYNPATGELTFTPESGFTTDPSDITYTLTENTTGLSDNAIVNVEYTEVPPVATDDEDLANVPGTAVTLNILANDQLSDGSPATVSNTTVDLNPALAGNQDTLTVAGEGQWVYNPATGELTFTPESGFTTDPSDITYTLTENSTGLSDNAIVNVEYTEVPPVATDDEDLANVPGTAVTLNILANDQLSDGSPATVSNTTVDLNSALAGNQDTLTVAGEGQWVYNPATGELTFTPESGFTTDPSDITYTLTENTTGLSDNATVNVEYTEVPPVATDDEDLANVPGTAVTLNILANDQLSDGSPATVSNTTVDLNPALAGNQDTLTVAGEGQWVYNPATGELTFTPESGFTTDPSEITYTLTENTTGLSDNAIVNVEYTEVPPVATDDEDLANVPGTAVTLNILANDQLSDGSPATVSNTTVDLNPALAGNQDTLTVAGEGQWVYDPSTGELTFTPESGFTTDPSDITYALTENTTGLSDNATVNVEYTEVPPVATDDEDLNNPFGQPVTLNIINNDDLSDGSPATVSSVGVDLTPNTVTIDDTLIVAGEGMWVYDPVNGEVTFTPEVGFGGNPTPIEYVLIEIATGLKDTANITVTYVPLEAADDQSVGNTPGLPVVINIIANDTLANGNPATPSEVIVDLDPSSAGVQDTLTVPGEGQWVYDPLTGELEFTPEPGFTGNPTPITYEITEIATGISETAQVTILYGPALPPVAEDDEDLNNLPGVVGTVNVLSNDTLSTGSLANLATAQVDLDLTTFGIDDTLVVSGEGTYVYNASTGVVSFTPESGFIGNPSPIEYVLIETATGLMDTAMITMTYLLPIEAVNDSSLNNVPGVNAVLTIVANDTLSDGNVATPGEVVIDLDLASAGIQTLLPVAGEGMWSYNAATGELTFDPETGFTTDPTPISYTIREIATGLIDTALVVVEYTEVPPVATDDEDLNNPFGQPVTLNIINNDDLSDGSPATVSSVGVDLTPNTVTIDDTLIVAGEGMWVYDPVNGEVTFTPEVGFGGNPTPIEYVLIEIATGLKDTANITVTYVPLEAADDQSVGNTPGLPVVINIIANDTLANGNPATPSEVIVDLDPSSAGVQDTLTVPGEGQWVYDPLTGELEFTPEPGFISSPTPISYEITEIATGITESAQVTILYGPALPPVAEDDEDLNNLPGVVGTVNVLSNDTLSTGSLANLATAQVDLDLTTFGIDDTLVVSGEGTYVYNASTGVVSFTPESGFIGNPSPIEYVLIETATGLMDTAMITMTYLLPIEAVNDSSLNNVPGVNAVLTIVANDTLSDGNVATPGEVVIDLDLASAGIQTLLPVAGEGMWSYNAATGELTFDPETGFTTDPTPISYTIREIATGLIDTALVVVEYTEVPPVATDDEDLNNPFGQPVTLNIINNDDLSDGSPATVSSVGVDLTPNTVTIDDTLIVAGEGMWVYDPVNGEVTFTPEVGFGGNPTPIEYVLIEIATGLKDTANITVTYVPLEAADDQSVGNTPGLPVVINIIANDTLANGNPATPSEVIVDLDPSSAGVQDTLTVPGEGQWVYDPLTGELEFTPEPGFTGNPTPITYEITEIATGISETAQVTILYGPALPPVAEDDEDLNNLPGVVGTVNVLSNDTLSTGSLANPATAQVDLDLTTVGIDDTLVVSGEGTYVYNASTGVVSFTPESGFIGNPSPIEYVLIETATGLMDTAMITMTYLLPIEAVNDSSLNNVPGVNAALTIVANDTLSDGNVATPGEVVIDLDLASAGIQTLLPVAGEGMWSYNAATGELTFDPETGFTTDPTPISYTIREIATGLIDTALVVVEYTEVPPVANTDSSLNNQPQTIVTVNILTNDLLSDNSPALVNRIIIDLEPGVGGDEQTLLVPGEGEYSYNALTGQLSFQPAVGFYGNPTPIVYSLREVLTGLSDTAQVIITNLFDPSLELIKVGTLVGEGYLNDSIMYSFTVINTGNIPVSGIVINDARISASPISVTPSGLAPGGIGVAQFIYPLTMSDILNGEVVNSAIASGLSVNAVVVTDTSDNGDPMMSGGSNPTVLNLPNPIIDVELNSSVVGDCERAIGDIVTVRMVVSRSDTTAVLSNVTVRDSLSSSFEFVSALPSEGSYNALTGEWTGISLGASGDSAILELQLRVLTNVGGLSCMTSWVESQTFDDVDSNPGNRVVTEDDMARTCITVPVNICPANGESVELTAGSGFTTYQWYRNGALVSGATNAIFMATEGGTYTVLVDGGSCPNSSCCPIIVNEVCPCPPQICLPVNVRKIR